MLNHYEYLKKFYENGAHNVVARIDRDPNSISYGTAKNEWSDTYNASMFFHYVFIFTVAYYLKDTKCYRDSVFLETADDVLSGSERYINEDGSIDLDSTNFHDPSYCAFMVRDCLGPAMDIIRKYSQHSAEEDKLEEHISKILKGFSGPLKHFGFHTPNHRWIICSALHYIHKFFGDEEAMEVINRYFSEGIDCDANGEYTERSAGTYNLICNSSFIQIAHTTGNTDFLEYPIRNMKLMYSYYEPDRTICTINSTRQDRGSAPSFDMYYNSYLPLAYYTGDSEFAYFADLALKKRIAQSSTMEKPYESCDALALYWFLMREDWIEKFDSIESVKPTRDASKYLEESGLARIYNRGTTLTVLRSFNADFLKFQMGSSSVYARFAGSFFGNPHSQFRPKKIEKTEKGYKVSSLENAGYRSQMPTPPPTSEWRKMDHSKREIINIQNFKTEVEVIPYDGGFSVDASYTGADRIPVKLEISMAPGCKVVTDQINFISKANDYIYLKEGEITLIFPGSGKLKIKGGSYAHMVSEGMRGTESVPSGQFTICITGKTPGKMHVEFEY